MKKISLKNLDSLGIEKLSTNQLKNTLGGNGQCNCPPGWVPATDPDGLCMCQDASGCAEPCGTGGRGYGDKCVTTDCIHGTCGWYMGFYGCA